MRYDRGTLGGDVLSTYLVRLIGAVLLAGAASSAPGFVVELLSKAELRLVEKGG